jgi:hypothetical protein
MTRKTCSRSVRSVAEFSVFLTGSLGYGKKWQADIDKRPHCRQTVEQTIAERLSFSANARH